MQERVSFRCDDVLLLAVPRVQNAGAWRASLLPKEGFWVGEASIVVSSEGEGKQQTEQCFVKFHNADGSLFALSDVSMPGAVEFTVDSSRYCIVTVINRATGQKKLVAMMFTKAQASSAFNCKLAVKDWKKTGEEPDEESAEVQALHKPLEDLSLAPGQMIVVKNVGKKKKKDRAEGKEGLESASSFLMSPPSSSSPSTPVALAPPPNKKDKKKKHKKKKDKQEDPFASSSSSADPFASASEAAADPFGGTDAAFGGDWSTFD
jgi:hypothetical protein